MYVQNAAKNVAADFRVKLDTGYDVLGHADGHGKRLLAHKRVIYALKKKKRIIDTGAYAREKQLSYDKRFENDRNSQRVIA